MRTEALWYIGYVAASVPLLVISAVGWYRASRRARRLEEHLLQREGGNDATQRLEQTVDALAGQMSELASAQEFMHRLLVRPPVPGAKRDEGPRWITPH